jgi:hypothetical protein
MRGFVDSVAFIHKPSNKEAVLKSLTKNLRLKNVQDAETGYEDCSGYTVSMSSRRSWEFGTCTACWRLRMPR